MQGIFRDRFIRTMVNVTLIVKSATDGVVIEEIKVRDTKAHRSVQGEPAYHEIMGLLRRRWLDGHVLSHALLSRFYLHGGKTKPIA